MKDAWRIVSGDIEQALLRHRKIGKVIAAMLLALVLANCTSSPHISQSALPPEKLTQWHAKGKLGVISDGLARTVNFDWKNRGQNFDIRLFGLLGIGGAQLKRNYRGIFLTTKDGKRYAASANQLISETLGWPLPAEELIYWVKGLPSPNFPVDQKRLNAMGKLETLVQQGWTLRFRSYHQDIHPSLPKKIIAERQGLRLTIAIKSWQF